MKKTTLSFTQEQLQVLNTALLEVPYRLAAPLISSINSQIQRQFDQRNDDDAPTGSNHNLPVTDASPNNL
jgi:hypothetical protein